MDEPKSASFWQWLQSVSLHCPNVPTSEDSHTQRAYDDRGLAYRMYVLTGFDKHVRREFATKVVPYINSKYKHEKAKCWEAAFRAYAIAECSTGQRRSVLHFDQLVRLFYDAGYSQGDFPWFFSPGYALTLAVGGHKAITKREFESLYSGRAD